MTAFCYFSHCCGHDLHLEASGALTVALKTKRLNLDSINPSNRENFVTNILIDKQIATINEYVNKAGFIENNPNNNAIEIEDNLGNEESTINYKTIHKIIGQENFILTISEGFIENQHAVSLIYSV